MTPATFLRLLQCVRIAIGIVPPTLLLFGALVANAVNNEYFRDQYNRTEFWLINGAVIVLGACIGWFIARYRRDSVPIGLGLAALGFTLIVVMINRF